MGSLADILVAALPAYGVAADAAMRERLEHFLRRVEGSRLRLVGSVDPEALVRRHLGESLYLGKVLPLDRQRVVDLGSGGGFPGLGLALAWPGLTTTLVESNGKKAAFLRSVVQDMDLGHRVKVWGGFVGARPVEGRAPVAGAELVTVRALERMERVPAWLGRWLDGECQVATWIGEEMAQLWQKRYPGWHWSPLHRLPGSERRGIVVGHRST